MVSRPQILGPIGSKVRSNALILSGLQFESCFIDAPYIKLFQNEALHAAYGAIERAFGLFKNAGYYNISFVSTDMQDLYGGWNEHKRKKSSAAKALCIDRRNSESCID